MSRTLRPSRAPGSIWCLRRNLRPPYIFTEANDLIRLDMGTGPDHYLSRADARLLAKRINQCLDDTVIR